MNETSVKAETFINSPDEFYHYESLFTSSFSKKFNYTRSGNVFEKLKCYQEIFHEVRTPHTWNNI